MQLEELAPKVAYKFTHHNLHVFFPTIEIAALDFPD